MAAVRNARLVFKKYLAEGYPIPGETFATDNSGTIDLDNEALNGGVLLKTLSISIDPYLRGRMNATVPEGYYATPFQLGATLVNWAVAKVLRSEHPDWQQGDVLTGVLEFAEYQILPKDIPAHVRKLPKDANIPWSLYVGIAGMPGRTAYYGWREICDAKKGETIYVSTAAGPVGSLVVQLAKLEGLKVIGSAGSADKVQFIRDIGADVAFNYKETSIDSVMKEHGPIDIYWDHIGNEALETVIRHMKVFGRVAVIGTIASYNNKPYPISNLDAVLYKSLKLQGMIVGRLGTKYWDDFYNLVPNLIKEGKIKYTEDIVRSLDDAGHLITAVQKGTNIGKAVIVLADE
ncbi:alcohol dehydrogenase [Auriculariales sp. MPI-PUGE-AT-0066]|nr:alcohol dehydrogenase [Auriculariales sp. MPI-PUGE-AT-0066]